MTVDSLKFHKCRLCHCIFYSAGKSTYCPECVPRYGSGLLRKKRLSELDTEERRKAERERWHRRMADPKFREAERLRSLARARAEKKYAKIIKEVKDEKY